MILLDRQDRQRAFLLYSLLGLAVGVRKEFLRSVSTRKQSHDDNINFILVVQYSSTVSVRR
jgi:hypothetical protein